MLKHYPHIEPLKEYEECLENPFQIVLDDLEEKPLRWWGDAVGQLQCVSVFVDISNMDYVNRLKINKAMRPKFSSVPSII